MILPEITISDSEAQLQWRARAYDKEYRDGYKVLAAIIDGDDVELLPDLFDTANPLFTTSKENQAWTRHEVSLANYVGKTIRIAFVNDSKDKTRLLVDDIFAGVPSTVGLLLDFDRTYDGYGDITISGRAFANLSEPVPSYTIGFEMNGETIEQTFNNELQPGVQVPFQLTGKAHLERNATAEYKAWITAGNDKSEINGKLSAFLWKVVAEEVTGTWCQYCVRGIGAMNYMRENDPDGFIGIAIHNNSSTSCPDSMAIPGEEYRAWIMNEYSMSGYPHCVLNRNAQYSTDPGNIPSYTARIKQSGKNYTGLSLTANYDSAADMISATTDVFFANDYENADFKLAYIVIENDVHRTHAQTGLINQYCGYDQINGYAGGAMGECYGFEELPSIINVFFKYQPDNEVERINDEMEAVIEDLSNTRDKVILTELSHYPFLAVKAHTRPFERKWMNVAAFIILPVGIFFYFRMCRFRRRLNNDLENIVKTNGKIVRRIKHIMEKVKG